MEDRGYQMTVDLNVLEHLGINLYSSTAAVLTEAVANAWDADAETVDIRIDPNGEWIEIDDDGIGMTKEDMNEKYLYVDYRRRQKDTEYGKCTEKGRKVMGRKGLGKLSLFSIAELIEVQSTKNGESQGFQMCVKDIREAIEEKEQVYCPKPLTDDAVKVTRGTKIVLRGIKRQRLGRSAVALRKRLARRFSVIGERHNFRIRINGDPITADDRGDLSMAQFLWAFGDFQPDSSSIPNVLEQRQLPSRCNDWDEDWNVNGWIGTVRLPKQLDSDEAGNLNGIVVFARGRLFHENILDRINDGRLYTKYLTGQIEADFLDTDSDPDIATSDRQRVQEDDPRYAQLLIFLRLQLTQVEKYWTKWRRRHEVEKAQEDAPALTEWFESLPAGFRKSAEALIARLSALPLDEEDDRRLLYRHGILAFERMRLRGSNEELVSSLYDVNRLLRILADRDALEASLYRDIVQSRLDTIREFQENLDQDRKEAVLQRYLFDHLWLLDPAWERATGSKVIESRLTEEGVLVDELTEKEKLSRVDIAYRTHAGKHIIVELKKASRKMKLLELQEQGQTYADKLRKILLAQEGASPNIEVVFILGKPVDEEESNPDRIKASMTAVSPGSRIVYYDALIRGAQNAYAEYLEKSDELDRLEQIVNRI